MNNVDSFSKDPVSNSNYIYELLGEGFDELEGFSSLGEIDDIFSKEECLIKETVDLIEPNHLNLGVHLADKKIQIFDIKSLNEPYLHIQEIESSIPTTVRIHYNKQLDTVFVNISEESNDNEEKFIEKFESGDQILYDEKNNSVIAGQNFYKKFSEFHPKANIVFVLNNAEIPIAQMQFYTTTSDKIRYIASFHFNFKKDVKETTQKSSQTREKQATQSTKKQLFQKELSTSQKTEARNRELSKKSKISLPGASYRDIIEDQEKSSREQRAQEKLAHQLDKHKWAIISKQIVYDGQQEIIKFFRRQQNNK